MSGPLCSFGQFGGREIEGYFKTWSKHSNPFLCIIFWNVLGTA